MLIHSESKSYYDNSLFTNNLKNLTYALSSSLIFAIACREENIKTKHTMFAPDWLNTKRDYYRIQSIHKACAAYTLIYPRQNENKQLKQFIWFPKKNRVVFISHTQRYANSYQKKSSQEERIYGWESEQKSLLLVGSVECWSHYYREKRFCLMFTKQINTTHNTLHWTCESLHCNCLRFILANILSAILSVTYSSLFRLSIQIDVICAYGRQHCIGM